MTGPQDDDLFDRLHAAADAVPPSTLDLPVVLLTSRRKSTVRRAVAGAAAVTAVAVLGVAVTSGVPGDLARNLVPAASYRALSTEIVHEKVAPEVTAVSEAATYERPDGTIVLDTGIGTGADGDRFMVVASVELTAGAPLQMPVDPTLDRSDPDYIQEMAALGYAPMEDPHVQVVVGDEAELERLRGGGTPTTVVLDDVAGMSTITLVTGTQLLLGLVEPSGGWSERVTYLSTWEPIPGPDGGQVTSVAVPTLPFVGENVEMYVVRSDVPGDRPPFRAALQVSSSTWNVAACSAEDPGCASTYDPQTGDVVRSTGTTDRRFVSPEDSVMLELSRLPTAAEPDVMAFCLGLRGEAVPRGANGNALPEDLGVDPDAWRRCLLDVSFSRA